VVAGILFGGSVFVLVMYWMLKGVSSEILEQEQEKAKLLAAEEGNRTKVEFLSSMSHEMRTPMNVILGLNRKALRSPSLSPEVRELLEKTELSARHLLDLINNVLDVNRMEKGVETAGLQPFSLQDVLNKVDAIAATQAEEKSLTYSLNTEGDISGTYMGDAVMLKQLLLIFLENAVKFTAAPGRIWLTVKKLPEEQGRYPVQFAVGDTGIGISEEFIPKVFEVFSKEDDSSTDAYGGSGLGLAVAKRIC
jgi:signal transduction histidine kinase